MRIQHNIMAMNAYRNYNTNTKALSGNLEKLSSGYKINRAGDDAAGLAISEKMRAQITGLDAAQKNVKDGISLVKTAEGAMQEIQDMLNRMDYLATQSANGTYQNEVDRENLQKEVDALKTEINRIADSANFNGIKLLDGSIEKSGAKQIDINGSDRILSSVIGEGEKAWAVEGAKTILDTAAASAAKGSFTVDLTTLKFSAFVKGSASAVASSAFNDFTLKIGDFEITVSGSKISAAAGTIDGDTSSSTILAAIASAVMTAIASEATGSASNVVTLNNVEWEVTNGGDGTLTFVMKNKPMTKAEAQTNFAVSVSMDDSDLSGSTGIIMNASHLHGTITNTPGVAAEDANKANTTFKITEEDIRDGAQITIGNTTVILKVGADSKTKKGKADALVDLSSMEEGKIDLNKALAKISESFGSSVTVDAKTNDGTDGSITFKVGVNDGSDGNPIGITVQRETAIGTADASYGAVFNTKDKLAGIFEMSYTRKAQTGLTLQIGDTSDSYNQMVVSVGDMHTSAMGTTGGKSITDIDISTQEGAQEAVQVVRDAINYVSSVRGDLGAIQNRLEHTGNNLSVMAENIQDAESTIRDTDVADEMMKYVKNNILVQSAQAMLAQANQVPQGVLQLLG